MVGGEHSRSKIVVCHGIGHKDANLGVGSVVCINIIILARPTEKQTICVWCKGVFERPEPLTSNSQSSTGSAGRLCGPKGHFLSSISQRIQSRCCSESG